MWVHIVYIASVIMYAVLATAWKRRSGYLEKVVNEYRGITEDQQDLIKEQRILIKGMMDKIRSNNAIEVIIEQYSGSDKVTLN